MHTLSITILDNQQNTINDVFLELLYLDQTYNTYSNEEGIAYFELITSEINDYEVATLKLFKDQYQHKTIVDLQIFHNVNSSMTIVLDNDETNIETIIIPPHHLRGNENA